MWLRDFAVLPLSARFLSITLLSTFRKTTERQRVFDDSIYYFVVCNEERMIVELSEQMRVYHRWYRESVSVASQLGKWIYPSRYYTRLRFQDERPKDFHFVAYRERNNRDNNYNYCYPEYSHESFQKSYKEDWTIGDHSCYFQTVGDLRRARSRQTDVNNNNVSGRNSWEGFFFIYKLLYKQISESTIMYRFVTVIASKKKKRKKYLFDTRMWYIKMIIKNDSFPKN